MGKIRHIIPISGKDSLATALTQIAKEPNIDYEFMFNPTGEELPEVFVWIEKVEKYLGKPIIQVGESLGDIIEYEMNWFLPSRDRRYCTRMSKIEPMEKFIGKEPALVYYGIRADENRGGYNNLRYKNITPVYPLKEAEINLAMVYKMNHNAGLKPPTFFWQRLWDEVVKIVDEAYIKATFKEWDIDALFAWRTRTNCSMCFNQRRYEWIGLLEHHPELFWKYEGWEHNVSEYFFNGKGSPLKDLAENSEKIFQRRVNAVVKFIESTRQMKLNFQLLNSDDDKDFIDMLQVTSCGLLCGK
ncbi:MAG: phosphoadenosine phosphosulfate reductase family protein [Saprospiraceae bacterium]